MSGKIAVIANQNSDISSLEDGASIILFEKGDSGKWIVAEEVLYALDFASDIAALRDAIRTLILRLGDCEIIVGKDMSGLPYHVFDRMGLYIFEASKISDSLFDGIISDIAAEKSEIEENAEVPKEPVSTGRDGRYFLDLVKLQKKHPEISSKKALQSFIMTADFYQLDVICSHMPPWMESAMEGRRLLYKIIKQDDDSNRVIIYKRGCEII